MNLAVHGADKALQLSSRARVNQLKRYRDISIKAVSLSDCMWLIPGFMEHYGTRHPQQAQRTVFSLRL